LDHRNTISEQHTTAALNFEYDFRYLLDKDPESPEEWKTFYDKFGIEMTPEETKNPDWIQIMAIRFLIANSERMSPEIIEHNFFTQL